MIGGLFRRPSRRGPGFGGDLRGVLARYVDDVAGWEGRTVRAVHRVPGGGQEAVVAFADGAFSLLRSGVVAGPGEGIVVARLRACGLVTESQVEEDERRRWLAEFAEDVR